MLRQEGISSFWRGSLSSFAKVGPSIAATRWGGCKQEGEGCSCCPTHTHVQADMPCVCVNTCCGFFYKAAAVCTAYK